MPGIMLGLNIEQSLEDPFVRAQSLQNGRIEKFRDLHMEVSRVRDHLNKGFDIEREDIESVRNVLAKLCEGCYAPIEEKSGYDELCAFLDENKEEVLDNTKELRQLVEKAHGVSRLLYDAAIFADATVYDTLNAIGRTENGVLTTDERAHFAGNYWEITYKFQALGFPVIDGNDAETKGSQEMSKQFGQYASRRSAAQAVRSMGEDIQHYLDYFAKNEAPGPALQNNR